MIRWWLVVGLLFNTLNAIHYWYPVASGNQTIYYILQYNLSHIELWAYNLDNEQLIPALPSGIVPSNVSIAQNHGFSFVDQNILKFKSFIKRSPALILPEKPLRFMSKVTWLDKHKGYLSALFRDHFGIFLIDLNGNVNSLVHDDTDALLPFVVDSHLFFMRRTMIGNEFVYKIACTSFRNFSIDAISEIYESDKPIIFLTMKSEKEGFFIEYDINSESIIKFSYKSLKKNNSYWISENLFSFYIPSFLIKGNDSDRIYESIAPFLPCIYKNLIFFCTSNIDSQRCVNRVDIRVDIMVFDQSDRQMYPLIMSNEASEQYFAPQIHGDKLWYGQSIKQSDKQIDRKDLIAYKSLNDVHTLIYKNS